MLAFSLTSRAPVGPESRVRPGRSFIIMPVEPGSIMGYATMDDRLAHHLKVRTLPPSLALAAFGLHQAAILFAQHYETDGRIQREDLALVFPAVPRPPLRLVDALIKVGLWDRHPGGGWLIHDYLDHNASKAERRAKARHAANVRWGRATVNAPGNAGGNARRIAPSTVDKSVDNAVDNFSDATALRPGTASSPASFAPRTVSFRRSDPRGTIGAPGSNTPNSASDIAAVHAASNAPSIPPAHASSLFFSKDRTPRSSPRGEVHGAPAGPTGDFGCAHAPESDRPEGRRAHTTFAVGDLLGSVLARFEPPQEFRR